MDDSESDVVEKKLQATQEASGHVFKVPFEKKERPSGPKKAARDFSYLLNEMPVVATMETAEPAKKKSESDDEGEEQPQGDEVCHFVQVPHGRKKIWLLQWALPRSAQRSVLQSKRRRSKRCELQMPQKYCAK